MSVPPYRSLPTFEGYFLGADGARLFYRVVGDKGDPVIFLHGGPGLGLEDGGYDIEPIAEQGHRLLMFNERGAGRSQIITDQNRLRMEDFVKDVEEFRKKFGFEHFAIIGLSWGSGVALTYITAHPDRVTRVVFLSPMSPTFEFQRERNSHLNSLKSETERRIQEEAREKIKTASDQEILELCHELFGSTDRLYVRDVSHFKSSHSNFCNLPAAGLRNFPNVSAYAFASLGDWDFRPEMKNVHIPALVIEGAETNVPLDGTREWAKSVPGARLLLIKHAGHQNWVDQPRTVISAMSEFLRGAWPAGSFSVASNSNAK